MPKLRVEDLERISQRVRKMTILREGAGRARITVHMGTCGIAAGARGIMNALMEQIEERDIQDVLLTASGCAGLCSQEPMATVELEGQAPVFNANGFPGSPIRKSGYISGGIQSVGRGQVPINLHAAVFFETHTLEKIGGRPDPDAH